MEPVKKDINPERNCVAGQFVLKESMRKNGRNVPIKIGLLQQFQTKAFV